MITCRQLTELPYANKLKLLAGKEGLGRQVQWVYYLEIPEYVKWLKGGELVILSGVLSRGRTEELIRLVGQLYDKQVAGIVVNLSSYIGSVPEAVIREGDALGLPVYEMPAEIRIVDISQSICFAVFQEKRREGTYKNILMEAIYGKRITEKRIKTLEREGFVEGDSYFTVVLQMRAKEKQKEENVFYTEDTQEALLDRMDNAISSYFAGENSRILHTFDEEQEILVLSKEYFEKRDLESWIRSLLSYLKKKEPSVELVAAVGTEFTNIRGIRDSVENALNLLHVCKGSDEEILILKNHTLEWVLMGITNRGMLKKIAGSVLGPLEEPQQEEMLNTLRMYLQCGGNKKEASQRLFVHVNTLNYRMQKLERLLELDLKDPNTVFSLELALRIHDYLLIL